MKKIVMISVAVIASLWSVRALAQEKELYRTLNIMPDYEALMDRNIQQRAIKEAGRDTKRLQKEGFRTLVGILPMDRQMENVWQKVIEVDKLGNPHWYISSAKAVGDNYSAAVLLATTTVKMHLAGQIRAKLTGLIEKKMIDERMQLQEAVNLLDVVGASTAIISGCLERSIPLLEIHRVLPDNSVEVMVTMCYSTEAANQVALNAIRADLTRKSQKMVKELDNLQL